MNQFNQISAESEVDALAVVDVRETDANEHGWPGDGSGEDDLADANANEADDYEGADSAGDAANEAELDDYYAEANDEAYYSGE